AGDAVRGVHGQRGLADAAHARDHAHPHLAGALTVIGTVSVSPSWEDMTVRPMMNRRRDSSTAAAEVTSIRRSRSMPFGL
ncbi:hypothetical protein ACWCSD_38825, partial [Nonomuraea sp. NPDC001684]